MSVLIVPCLAGLSGRLAHVDEPGVSSAAARTLGERAD